MGSAPPAERLWHVTDREDFALDDSYLPQVMDGDRLVRADRPCLVVMAEGDLDLWSPDPDDDEDDNWFAGRRWAAEIRLLGREGAEWERRRVGWLPEIVAWLPGGAEVVRVVPLEQALSESGLFD